MSNRSSHVAAPDVSWEWPGRASGTDAVHIDAYTDSSGINQDRFVATPIARGVFVVVCDGAGGITGGARAAEAVIRELVLRSEHLGLDELERQIAMLDRVLELDVRCGETTCVALWVTPHEVYGVSAGDSEAWWLGADAAVDLTGKQHRARVGSGHARPTPFRRVRQGGHVVVGTDGFFRYAAASRWHACVREAPQPRAGALVRVARLPTSKLQDDATVVVVSRG